MQEEEQQPQTEGTQEAAQAEVEGPQPAEPTAEAQPGAEEEPQAEVKAEPEKAPPAPRVYSQEEWSKRESEVQKQVTEANTRLSELTLQHQIADLERDEASAQTRDQKLVDEGEITQVEAVKRREERSQERQEKADTARTKQIAIGIRAEAEQLGRILAARDFGKQYRLTEDEIDQLSRDRTLDSPAAIEAKAANLALEKTQGKLKTAEQTRQQFDQGQAGSAGSGNADKVIERYGRGEASRAEYEAAMKAKNLTP